MTASQPPETAPPAPNAAAASVALVETPALLLPGHAVKLLRNGDETFPAWLAAIDAARERVSLEMYIFNDDVIGQTFAAALGRAAARGVTVRVLYDFVGSLATPAIFFSRLRGYGVHVTAYHRYRFWRPKLWSLFRRDHRKTLVCDGRIAFAGGLNIADEWLNRAQGGGGWHDAAIQVEGPAAGVIERTFVRIWNRRGPKPTRLDPAEIPIPGPAGDVALTVIANSERQERFAIRRALLHAIRASRAAVQLANPYFVPDRRVLRALRRAAARGVSVRLLVPSVSDSRLLDYAARAVFGPLLAAGVRIWRSRVFVHTKAMVVDGSFVSIGSYNFDQRSLAYNLELVVNVLDPGYAGEVAAMIEGDIAASHELTAEAFARRSALGRLLERLAYSLRRWL